MVENNSWDWTLTILPVCLTSGLSRMLRQEKALGRELQAPGPENYFWYRPEGMSRILTPPPPADWQYRNTYQNSLNRLYPLTL